MSGRSFPVLATPRWLAAAIRLLARAQALRLRLAPTGRAQPRRNDSDRGDDGTYPLY